MLRPSCYGARYLLCDGCPTPWIGLWERINISVFLLWIAVLATPLLRTPNFGDETRQGQDHE